MDSMKGVFQGFDIANSALNAELQRSEVVSSNLANMHVTGGPDGEPYRRKTIAFEEVLLNQSGMTGAHERGSVAASGVRIRQLGEDHATPFFEAYDPGHPDANAQGFVLRSNVDMFRELMDMTVIRRSFQANLAALRSYRGMLQATITNFR